MSDIPQPKKFNHLYWIIPTIITSLFIIIFICGFLLLRFVGRKVVNKVETTIDNWEQENKKWREIEIKTENYKGTIMFSAQNAHPFLAEYNYKIKITENNVSKEIDLPMNTGGQISEPVYEIIYDNKIYLEFLFQAKDFLLLNLSTKEIEDSDQVNKIRVYGQRKYIGTVLDTDEYKNFTFTKEKTLNRYWNIEEKTINWGDWINLPNKTGKLRTGNRKEDSHNKYFQLENETSERYIFEYPNIENSNTTHNIYYQELDGKNYLIFDDNYEYVYFVKNLFFIEPLIQWNNNTSSYIILDQDPIKEELKTHKKDKILINTKDI